MVWFQPIYTLVGGLRQQERDGVEQMDTGNIACDGVLCLLWLAVLPRLWSGLQRSAAEEPTAKERWLTLVLNRTLYLLVAILLVLGVAHDLVMAIPF